MPQKAEQLQKRLPGVGPYTAAAIGSVNIKKLSNNLSEQFKFTKGQLLSMNQSVSLTGM